ncbi:MAG: tetratricopeptide (TPR) repeat protein [Lentimonas sp.]|jgi:tetratricopeptide (TPR) repeat protein
MSESQTTEERPPRTRNLSVPPSKNDAPKTRRKRSSAEAPPRARLRAYFALIALVILVFSPLLSSDVLWSDYDSVERSPFQSMESWQQAWTLDSIRQNDPITITSYFLEQAIPLPAPAVHRGINILLHIFAAILLLKNLETLKFPAAFSAALIFALHPATIQTLFWAGYRTEIVGLIFILTALYFGSRNRSARDYTATILLTTIACLIHPAAFAIPLILALIILNQERHIHVYSFNRVLPLVCLCLFLAVWLNSGSTETAEALSTTDRLNHAGQNMAHFSRQALVPINSALFHPFDTGANYQIGAQMSLLPFLLFIPFFILIAFNIKKTWSRAILLGLSAYLLLIAFGTSQDGHFIDGELAHEDHHLYVALPMILALVITALGRFIYNMGVAGKPIWAMACSLFLFIEIAITGSFTYSIAEPTRMWTVMSERWPNAWQPQAALIDRIPQADSDEEPLFTNKELISMLEAVLKKRPDLIEKRKLLARTFATEGQRSNALREYKRILRETSPDNEFLEEAARFLDKSGLGWDATKTRERKTKTQ